MDVRSTVKAMAAGGVGAIVATALLVLPGDDKREVETKTVAVEVTTTTTAPVVIAPPAVVVAEPVTTTTRKPIEDRVSKVEERVQVIEERFPTTSPTPMVQEPLPTSTTTTRPPMTRVTTTTTMPAPPPLVGEEYRVPVVGGE